MQSTYTHTYIHTHILLRTWKRITKLRLLETYLPNGPGVKQCRLYRDRGKLGVSAGSTIQRAPSRCPRRTDRWTDGGRARLCNYGRRADDFGNIFKGARARVLCAGGRVGWVVKARRREVAVRLVVRSSGVPQAHRGVFWGDGWVGLAGTDVRGGGGGGANSRGGEMCFLILLLLNYLKDARL